MPRRPQIPIRQHDLRAWFAETRRTKPPQEWQREFARLMADWKRRGRLPTRDSTERFCAWLAEQQRVALAEQEIAQAQEEEIALARAEKQEDAPAETPAAAAQSQLFVADNGRSWLLDFLNRRGIRVTTTPSGVADFGGSLRPPRFDEVLPPLKVSRVNPDPRDIELIRARVAKQSRLGDRILEALLGGNPWLVWLNEREIRVTRFQAVGTAQLSLGDSQFPVFSGGLSDLGDVGTALLEILPRLMEAENLPRALQMASENEELREAIFASIREALERLIVEAEIDRESADVLRALLEALFEAVEQQRLTPILDELEIQLDAALRESGLFNKDERRILIAILKAIVLHDTRDLSRVLAELLEQGIQESNLGEPWRDIIPGVIRLILRGDTSLFWEGSVRVLLDELREQISELDIDGETKSALLDLLRAVERGSRGSLEDARERLAEVAGADVLTEVEALFRAVQDQDAAATAQNALRLLIKLLEARRDAAEGEQRAQLERSIEALKQIDRSVAIIVDLADTDFGDAGDVEAAFDAMLDLADEAAVQLQAAGRPEAARQLQAAFRPIGNLRREQPELWAVLAVGLAAVSRRLRKDKDEDDEEEPPDPDAHRGRIQAQGGGVEESVAWARPTPPTVQDGLRMVEQLEALLSPSQREEREFGFVRLRRFIENAGKIGGAGRTDRSWKERTAKSVRVDLEIKDGRAFVP